MNTYPLSAPRYIDTLDELVATGALTPEEAAEEWYESHADDERDER
jgi:hypothetical protein